MGICCSAFRKRRPRGDEREPLLPKYTPEIPPQSQFDKAADILAALSTGKYPSQDQINRALGLLLSSDVLKSNTALSGTPSQHGQKLLNDIRGIVQALLALGIEKNGDDRLQDLLWQASRVEEVPVKMSMDIDASISLDLEGASKPPPEMVSQEELAQDAHRIVTSVRLLISLLITSNTFRHIISDILFTARDILADIALDVAKVAAILEVRAEQVEEAVRPTETELAAGKVREGGIGVPALEELAHTGKSEQELAADATNMALEESEARRKAIWDRLENESPDRIKETALDRISEIVEQAQASPRYTAALATLANLSRKYLQKLAFTAEAPGDATIDTEANLNASTYINPRINTDPHLTQCLEDAKILLQRFSGHGTDLLGQKITLLLHDFSSERGKGDDSLPVLIIATSDWLKRALLQPGWIRTPTAQQEGSRLYDQLSEFLRRDSKLKSHARGVVEELYVLRDALVTDRSTNVLLSAIHTLLSDLESMGRTGLRVVTVESAKQWETAKAELWRDIVGWVLPRVLRALRAIPLPRVELKSDTLDIVVDKVTLASPSFIPDHVQISNCTDFLLRASDATTDAYFETSTSTRTTVVIRGLRISVEDIAYYLNAKGPFLTGWQDNGLVTVDVGGKRVEGDGVSIALDIEVPSQESRDGDQDLFRVLDAKVDVPGLAFSLKQTRHWIFNTLVAQPLLGPLVRTGVSLVLSAQIKAGLEALNIRLCSLRDKSREIHGRESSALLIEDYWEAFTQSQQEETRNHSPGHSIRSDSPSHDQGTQTRVETEATAKGIIRTTVREDADGETQSETVLAIGIGEQILPGLGGPDVEVVPTLTEQGREILEDLDQLQKGAKGQVKEVVGEVADANEVTRARLSAAGAQMQRRISQFAKDPDWKSSAFEL